MNAVFGNSLTLPQGSSPLPHGSTTFPSRDKNISVTLSASRAGESASQLTDDTFTPILTRALPEDAFASKIHAIESPDKLCEGEKILQRRPDRGRRLRAKRAKRYLVQWAPSRLSFEELRCAQHVWKMVKTSLGRHAKRKGPQVRAELESTGPHHGYRLLNCSNN